MSRSSTKKRILIFCDYYLPSVKSGGGMWTVANLVDHFRDRYDFFIINKNHDIGSENEPYPNVRTNEWNSVSGAEVFYADNATMTTGFVASVVKEVGPNLVVLNSGLSRTCRRFLWARQKGRISRSIPVMLFATGEWSRAALSLKPLKKQLFLAYAKLTGLYRGVIWKASFETEADEVRDAIGPNARIAIAPDLSPKVILPDFDPAKKPPKSAGAVKLVFLSRIVPKKNLGFLLERLSEIRSGNVELHIVGPVGEQAYWTDCQDAIRSLPQNVSVRITGAVENAAALSILLDAHFFVLSTVSENFGYVFLEALAAGSPLIISDRTVWEDIEEKAVGWRIPLEDPQTWRRRLEEAIAMDAAEYSEMSARARQYALDWLAKPDTEIAVEKVLLSAMNEEGAHAG